jgi:hypothetical protein
MIPCHSGIVITAHSLLELDFTRVWLMDLQRATWRFSAARAHFEFVGFPARSGAFQVQLEQTMIGNGNQHSPSWWKSMKRRRAPSLNTKGQAFRVGPPEWMLSVREPSRGVVKPLHVLLKDPLDIFCLVIDSESPSLSGMEGSCASSWWLDDIAAAARVASGWGLWTATAFTPIRAAPRTSHFVKFRHSVNLNAGLPSSDWPGVT